MSEAVRRWQIGSELPPVVLPEVTLETLGEYARASGDFAAVHLDHDEARSFGFPGAFAHGLLSMAWVGRAITDVFPSNSLRSFSVRFVAPVYVGESIRCSAQVVSEAVVEGERRLGLVLRATDGAGNLKIDGKAMVADAGS